MSLPARRQGLRAVGVPVGVGSGVCVCVCPEGKTENMHMHVNIIIRLWRNKLKSLKSKQADHGQAYSGLVRIQRSGILMEESLNTESVVLW